MTETTDIEALRRRSNTLRTADQTDAFIDLLLDKLEAERQRADELNINWDAAKNAIQFYKAELEVERQRGDDAESKLRSEKLVHLVTKDAMRKAHRRVVELEGDQVPVSAEFFADGKWWPFSNAEHKENTIAAGYPVRELFTAQPKPVVVLSDCDIAAVSHMAHWYSEKQCEAWVAGVEHAKKQMLAAGIVVKDGE